MPNKYSEASYTSGGDFVYKDTNEPYKGYYFSTYKNVYLSGKKPEDGGKELIKLKGVEESKLGAGLITASASLLLGLAKGVFKREPTKSELTNGKLTRYFIQEKSNKKIQEVDSTTYLQSKRENLPNKSYLDMEWVIAGPAENVNKNRYLYEGAAARNERTIKSSEATMQGISKYVTDYTYLVQEIEPKHISSYSEVRTEKNQALDLENSRKANFDYRK